MQAAYDLFYKRDELASYDHIQFQGVVPRTFLCVKWIEMLLFRPLRMLFGDGANSFLLSDGMAVCYLVRLFVAACTFFAFVHLGKSISTLARQNTYDHHAILLMFLSSQFHLVFYGSRTLPNTFALQLSTVGLSWWLRGADFRAVFALTVCALVVRCETALMWAAVAVDMFLFSKRPYRRLFCRFFMPSLLAACVALPATIFVDSFYWRRSEYSVNLCKLD
ncbi:unnamed protein product, partial [Amoebophrya sp. A25]|eukprot:GSA25T00015447001.1